MPHPAITLIKALPKLSPPSVGNIGISSIAKFKKAAFIVFPLERDNLLKSASLSNLEMTFVKPRSKGREGILGESARMVRKALKELKKITPSARGYFRREVGAAEGIAGVVGYLEQRMMVVTPDIFINPLTRRMKKMFDIGIFTREKPFLIPYNSGVNPLESILQYKIGGKQFHYDGYPQSPRLRRYNYLVNEEVKRDPKKVARAGKKGFEMVLSIVEDERKFDFKQNLKLLFDLERLLERMDDKRWRSGIEEKLEREAFLLGMSKKEIEGRTFFVKDYRVGGRRYSFAVEIIPVLDENLSFSKEAYCLWLYEKDRLSNSFILFPVEPELHLREIKKNLPDQIRDDLREVCRFLDAEVDRREREEEAYPTRYIERAIRKTKKKREEKRIPYRI
jgi:hypothetical protein